MGTRMAPQYGNILKARLEEDVISDFSLKPLLYLQYLDDIFMILTHDYDNLVQFSEAFNSKHSSIHLTLEWSKTEVNFLDTQVTIIHNKVQSSLYRKLTDSFTYLH